MKNQFETIQPWIVQILNTIKKDIKTEHLGSDPVFYKTNFGNRPQNRLGAEEIFAAYEKELLKGNEDLSEWVVNRWVFKNGDLYRHFAERLSAIHPDFDQIKNLTEEQSREVLKGTEGFDAVSVFLFSVLNGVVFPDKIVEKLRKTAETEAASKKVEEASAAEQQSIAKIVEHHQREVARMNEKYETKLSGVQKKYATDTEALKKQIRALQQRLNSLQKQ